MKIKSEIGTGSLYGDDALEAFYNAVDNGQARLALQFLTEIVEVLIEKIDAIENYVGITEVSEQEVQLEVVEPTVEAPVEPEMQEEVLVVEQKVEEAPQQEPKVKSETKTKSSQKEDVKQ